MSSTRKNAAFVVVSILSALILLAIGSAPAGFSSQLYLPVVDRQFIYSSPTPQPGRLLVSEVYYDPLENEPDDEWVEVYNPGSLPLSLGGYRIGDEETRGEQEGMYSFPPGAVIQPGQVLVLANRAGSYISGHSQPPDFEFTESDPAVPNMIKIRAWAEGNLNLVNQGDEVIVLDGSDQIADLVAWGNSSHGFSPPVPKGVEGHSLERWPADQDTNSGRDWRDQWQPGPGQVDLVRPTATPPPSPTPTASMTPTNSPIPVTTDASSTPDPLPSTSTPQPSKHLLISEVFYSISTSLPGYSLADATWFKIHNTTGLQIDLSNHYIGNGTSFLGDPFVLPSEESMYRFPSGTKIDPEQELVIALKGVVYEAIYHTRPDFEMVSTQAEVPDMIQEPDLGSNPVLVMNLTGDEIVLLAGKSEIVDLAAYGSSNASYFGVSPHPGARMNYSLRRNPPGNDTDHCEIDFQEVFYPPPGS